jgi:hypothetical protein
VAIFEKREESITVDAADSQNPGQLKKFTYLAKPFEATCRDNMFFFYKHLKETLYESGI